MLGPFNYENTILVPFSSLFQVVLTTKLQFQILSFSKL